MWLILPSGDPPRSDSDPAAGRAVSASNDASTAGTTIRTRAFIKFLLPLASPDRYSLGSLFTRPDERNQEGSVKASSTPPEVGTAGAAAGAGPPAQARGRGRPSGRPGR